MIRASNHSSFPKIGDSPLDQFLRVTLTRQARGAAGQDEVNEAIDETTTIVVAQQARSFIDIVTDGMVRWDGPLSHVAHHLEGLEAGELFRWFDTNFYDRRPVVTGPIRRRGEFLVHDFNVALGVAIDTPVKPVLPGPVTFARLARDEHYGDLGALADALADALAKEVQALAEAGASMFQLDEPLLCRHPDDLPLIARATRRVMEAAGPEATTILSTYFGDLSAIAGSLADLPGTHIGLDMVSSPANFDLLPRLPAGRGVMLGLFDARSTVQEDADDVIALLEKHRDALRPRDVLIAPNAGLELLPRDEAFDKLLHARYVVEKLSPEWK